MAAEDRAGRSCSVGRGEGSGARMGGGVNSLVMGMYSRASRVLLLGPIVPMAERPGRRPGGGLDLRWALCFLLPKAVSSLPCTLRVTRRTRDQRVPDTYRVVGGIASRRGWGSEEKTMRPGCVRTTTVSWRVNQLSTTSRLSAGQSVQIVRSMILIN